jgi:hypothetical protein
VVPQEPATFQTFRLDPLFRGFCVFWAAVCVAIVVPLPLGLVLLRIARHARVELYEDRLVARWVRTHETPWADVVEWRRIPTRGGTALLAPLLCKTRTSAFAIPVGSFDRTETLVAELRRRTGLPILPPLPDPPPVRIPTWIGAVVLLLLIAVLFFALARPLGAETPLSHVGRGAGWIA